MANTSEAKSLIKRWSSLQKVAKQLKFYITDEHPEGEYEYVAVPKAMERHIPVLLALHDQNGYRGNYLLWYLKDIEGVLDFLGGIALAQGKVLTTSNDNNDKWILVNPDKFSAKELTNRD
jgi:phage host-nuclease inhibitor protein Gam